jgi:7,8-dihydropterin-6-yl-methyl-4-(beta-D-ribofuranosyl)aminobenzene 5'-phosphate synthase
MNTRIITLSENTAAQSDVLAEWGLSFLIETGEQSILLDTGASISLVHNAEILGIDLSKIRKIILSHGHFDHTGGLRQLLGYLKREIEIIAHPNIRELKYSRYKGKRDRYIGIPYRLQELESLGARFTLSKEPIKLGENITTTGEIPMETDFEEVGDNFVVQTTEGWKHDQLLDDQAIVIKCSMGLVIVLGCAHRGMINTLRHACRITGVKKIHMVLGGSHLKDASDEQIWQAISSLNEMGVQKVGVSHCTGMRATLLLAQIFGNDFIFNYTGNIINLS